jgi:hypothetical protein
VRAWPAGATAGAPSDHSPADYLLELPSGAAALVEAAAAPTPDVRSGFLDGDEVRALAVLRRIRMGDRVLIAADRGLVRTVVRSIRVSASADQRPVASLSARRAP